MINRKQIQCGGFSATIAESGSRAEAMTDVLMLVAAAVGSMAFSLLVAFGILRVGFALMRPQPRPAEVMMQPNAARVS
jgi:hypothetical protein